MIVSIKMLSAANNRKNKREWLKEIGHFKKSPTENLR